MNEKLLEALEDMGAEVEDTLERLMGDEELYVQYLKQFPDNQNIIELQRAVSDQDSAKAEREVHTLKGVALNLGLLPLADACMDMLLDLRDGKPEAAFAQMDLLEDTFQQWSDVITENN